jgi:Response regulator containing CheY-like receiver, AAA-type ATPase, and DNA-binding domains
MAKGNILVVDDNKSILSTLEILLSSEFQAVTSLSNPNQIFTELEKKNYNVVLLDMNFNTGINTGNEGIYLLGRIKEIYPEISVVMMTAYGDIELAVKSLKTGSTDFVLKPWDNQKLIATLEAALQLNLSKKEITMLKEKEKVLKNEINRDQKFIIGTSPGLMKVLSLVHKVAATDVNVLITGENGTGKELIAREIHHLSKRTDEVLVSVDMGSITETLFESELFGHVKGAFTDASESRPGKFEAASKGTLFLDEIGNLPLHLQPKILAAIQNKTITRIGSTQQVSTDIRLLCATNRNLDQMVKEGLFREDLLYRINTIHIEVPPLRERSNDILVLTEFFLKKYSYKYNKQGIRINQAAMDKLLRYPWPGNVRELQHAIEKAVILSDKDILSPDDFFTRNKPGFSPYNSTPTLEEMEKQLIQQALDRNNGNFSAAAAQLGITRQTIYNKMKRKKDDQ